MIQRESVCNHNRCANPKVATITQESQTKPHHRHVFASTRSSLDGIPTANRPAESTCSTPGHKHFQQRSHRTPGERRTRTAIRQHDTRRRSRTESHSDELMEQPRGAVNTAANHGRRESSTVDRTTTPVTRKNHPRQRLKRTPRKQQNLTTRPDCRSTNREPSICKTNLQTRTGA